MKQHAFNPYLPPWEFVPDGEPHIFGDRLYLYGSHDAMKGTTYCSEDYVVWSAPVDDLSDWRCEGVSYRKDQDPLNGAPYEGVMPKVAFVFETPHKLYAPDVAQGPDGRYYLYYSLDFTNIISVAVGNSPAGPFEFLDYVRRADGTLPECRWFDPAILCEESGNYLYFGFAPAFRLPGMGEDPFPGALMVKLADDMHTIITEPVCVANGVDTAKGTCYEDHPFFEAASIRKIGDWYYFVYSSLQGHELCYAMAKSPEGPFEFKGVIHSNCDLGYHGNRLPIAYYGNNHGSLANVNGKVYIFGHRQTHGTEFSRQGIAEEVTLLPDGTIPQVELTSCGLNGGPLPAKDSYSAHIACHLTEKDRTKVGRVFNPGPGGDLTALPPQMPYITEEGSKPFIANLLDGSAAGFKYFSFDASESAITLELRGTGAAQVRLDSPEGPVITALNHASDIWQNSKSRLTVSVSGVHAVYVVVASGKLDFASFAFE